MHRLLPNLGGPREEVQSIPQLLKLCVEDGHHTGFSGVHVFGEFVKIEEIGNRYVIEYFYLKGLNQTNVKAKLDSTLGESVPCFTTVKYWLAEFKRGRMSCKDEHRNNQRNDTTTPEMVKKNSQRVTE
ncbi:unnamed protein product [Euphydryas editha]|uniref:Mos1 transposase HTH domain-containing protein n=1 Tax=Euphydryas editha TaxID=104508 RepID=A0AAU9TKA0_EUPED|nr:unnamed protein product [Euphydryas editha]